jgi:hypothetical protein
VSGIRARHRQLLGSGLFLAAIIAPSVLLVTLSLRLIAQDGELAAQPCRRLHRQWLTRSARNSSPETVPRDEPGTVPRWRTRRT